MARERRAELASLMTLAAVVSAIVFAARPVVAYRAAATGITGTEYAFVVASYGTLAAVLAVPAGHLIDRRGPASVLGTGTLLLTLASIAAFVVRGSWQFAAALAALGLGQMLAAGGTQAILLYDASTVLRTRRVGSYAGAASFGQTLGPIVGGAVVAGTVSLPVTVVLLVISLVAACLCMWVLLPRRSSAARAGHQVSSRFPIRQLLTMPGVPGALAAGIIVITGVDLIIAYLPALAFGRGEGPEAIGILIGTFSVAQIGARIVVAPAASRIGLTPLLGIGMAGAALVLPFIALVPSTPVLFAGTAIVGFFLGLGVPLTLVRLADLTPPSAHGKANGLRFSANRLSQVVLPAVIGGTAGVLGTQAVLVAAAAVLVGGSAAVLGGHRRTAPAA